ncbi:MAG: methylenetetrahydrofolate reductase (NADPH) [bacterium]
MTTLISEIYKRAGNHVSFEIFPPKGPKGLKQIYQTIANLKDLDPSFFSVTYGAGGSTAEKSLEIASAVQNLAEVTCVSHFTCVGMNQEQVKNLLDTYHFHGINNVLALRGDPPKGETSFVKTEGGFAYATELVKFIRKETSDLGILVAGYPEGHHENTSAEQDFQFLLDKVNAGADGIVTQLFFENKYFLDFKEKLDKNGVNIPLAAGIFPISNSTQLAKINELSGAEIPLALKRGTERFANDAVEMEKFGTDFAIKQVEELLKEGVKHFHFYTMNRYSQTRKILYGLQEHFPNLNFSS